jgi:hypothetical protein
MSLLVRVPLVNKILAAPTTKRDEIDRSALLIHQVGKHLHSRLLEALPPMAPTGVPQSAIDSTHRKYHSV